MNTAEEIRKLRNTVNKLNTKIATSSFHNNLNDIQGGQADEYYHLNLSEHTELVNWLNDVTLGSDGSMIINSNSSTGEIGHSFYSIVDAVGDPTFSLIAQSDRDGIPFKSHLRLGLDPAAPQLIILGRDHITDVLNKTSGTGPAVLLYNSVASEYTKWRHSGMEWGSSGGVANTFETVLNYRLVDDSTYSNGVILMDCFSGKGLTGSSGNQSFFKINPNIKQGGTASYTAILLDVTETSTGSGSQSLIDLQIGSVSKFLVSNDGATTIQGDAAILLNVYNDSTSAVGRSLFTVSNYGPSRFVLENRNNPVGDTIWLFNHDNSGNLRFTKGSPTVLMQFSNLGFLTLNSGLIVNEGGLDIDSRMESNNENKLLFLDAGTDQLRLGDGDTNYFLTDKTGLTYWVGGGGLIFGVMYIESEIVVSISGTSPVEIKDSSLDGWTAGQANKVVFPAGGAEHYLPVPKPGRYEVIWDISCHIAAGAGSEIFAGVMVDNTAIRDDGEGERTVTSLNDTGSLGSNTVIDCPNGTEQISLWIANDNSNDVHVVKGNVLIKQIAGT
jgi:hypothetical protein